MNTNANTDVRSAVLENTRIMLEELSMNELQAVQSVIRVILTKDDVFYKPLSEEELLKRIDESIVQADAGLAVDSELAEEEIMAEFGL